MKLQMTHQQQETRKKRLIHRVTTSGTRCGIEMINPIVFEGSACDITCKKCLVHKSIHEVL